MVTYLFLFWLTQLELPIVQLFHKIIQNNYFEILTLLVPIPKEESTWTWAFIFKLFCGTSEGFIKAFKAFMKLLAATQRSVKKLS